MKSFIFSIKLCTGSLLLLVAFSCDNPPKYSKEIQQWTSFEIALKAEKNWSNGYTEAEVWAIFTNGKGDTLLRPAFWDGDQNWKIRFAPPDTGSVWHYATFASVNDKGLSDKKGSFRSIPYQGDNNLLKHGLLTMSQGKRNVIHADGTSFLVVGDTPLALPFRATAGQVREYAGDRQIKGFNTALLMSVQPDQYAEGPEARNTVLGFDRGFADLHEGHLNKLKPDYFKTLDTLVGILLEHGIVPVYQPVFHGYGWKGLTVLGPAADPGEYARYCKYLVARYGSMPAVWLVSGDANGLDPGVKPGGETIERWDCYQQPTGIHYNPADDYLAEWAQGDSSRCLHYNRSYQEEPWLDFQWAQTGHDGKHLYHKVERMYENQPVKANLNGEPTYEGMGGGKQGKGWWQGEEAWNQLMHGGTMGVIYGAACLWQWKIKTDEPGWPEWTNANLSWKEALQLEGSRYVGLVSKAFQGFDFADMEKRPDLTGNLHPLLALEGKFYVSYMENGGVLSIDGIPEGMPWYWYNPEAGEFSEKTLVSAGTIFEAPSSDPWVFVAGYKKSE
jgi:hypothetical protein